MMSFCGQLWDNLRRSRLLGTALFGLAIFHLAIQLIVVMPRNLAVTDREDNIRVYYRAAQNARQRRDIYQRQPANTPTKLGTYIYAPYFAAIISPFSILPFPAFVRLFYCLTFICFWIFAWCLVRLSCDGKADVRKVLICGLILDLFPGGYAAFSVGQIEPLLWALFGIGLLGTARSAFWVTDALIKPFYLWPFLANITDVICESGIKVLLRKLAPAIILTGALVLCGGLICGWNSYDIWVRDVLPTLSQGNFSTGNVSLSFLVLRVARYCGWHYAGGPLPPVAHFWLTAASIAAPLIVWRVLRRTATPLKYAALVAAAILFSPVCWVYYLPMLLPLIALLWQHKSTFNASR
jgi:hypothetical protein